MKRGALLLLAGLSLLAATACHHRRGPKVPPPVPLKGHVQEGVSSWYGKEFDGRPTSSGEIFDMHALTAAHRTLPLGTTVRVTNLDNGKEAVLKVNDRGPFIAGRVLDCSYGAAKALGFVGAGLARVRIEVIQPGRERPRGGPPPAEVPVTVPGQPSPVFDGSFCVQAGAFSVRDNALRFRDQLASVFGDAYVVEFRGFYRVRVGHLDTEEQADELRGKIQKYGIESFVTRND
jgi:rare lipoprotein A